MFALRGKDLGPRAIGDALGVATLLEGTVRRAGDRLRVGAQLVSASDNAVLWADEYDRELRDVFAVQDEISRAIVSALRPRLKLTGGDTTLVREATANPEAHDLYLKGRYAWNRRNAAALEQAVEYFERAVALDPRYARAYAGMADAYLLLPAFAGVPPAEAWPKARRAAERALALDSSLAEAQTSLAYGATLYEWDWAAAERGFRRAIALDPNYATAHHWYGDFLDGRGRLAESLREKQRALALDPLSLIIGAEVGRTLGYLHRDAEAEQRLVQTVQLDPSFYLAHYELSAVYAHQGRWAEAVAEGHRSVELNQRDPTPAVYLVSAYAGAGMRDSALALIRELEARRRREYVPPFLLARVYTSLGDKDRAFAWLTRAVEERDQNVEENLFDPALDPLRADPRFARVRARMGLAP
jgi:tetratricopeptide (TPR) repeat protein